MAFGSSSPRIRPSLAASRCARRALRRREARPAAQQAGGDEVLGFAHAIARRDPVPAPQLLGLFDKHQSTRESARAKGLAHSKCLELYALLGGQAMHRQAYKAISRRDGRSL